jgi:eukaryotic-like serine/threonine-protein kinase
VTIDAARSEETSTFEALLREAALTAPLHNHGPLFVCGERLAGGRFRLDRLVGAGGMGMVYEAWDRDLDAKVALKTLRSARSDQLVDLRREFRAAADLHHPNLVKASELFEDRGRLFFTMELVHGITFTAWARSDSDRLRRGVGALAAALEALHASGRVHRDIKPSNILVTDDERVVLLDLGLARRFDDLEADDHRAGTLAYMAPEQWCGEGIGPPADMYALGATMFEVLAERVPFTGDRAEMALVKAQRARCPPIASVRPSTPEDLARWCDALLDPDPARRPSASEVCRALAELDSTQAAGIPSPPSASSSALPAPARTEPSSRSSQLFVGRSRELEQMALAFSAARERGPLTMFVQGEAGVGKTALLSEFCARLPQGALVLSSRCHENEFIPHKALDGIVEGLSRELVSRPARELVQLLDTESTAIARVFPVFRRALERGVSDSVSDEQPTSAVVARALARLDCVPEAPGDRSSSSTTAHSARRAAFRELANVLSRLAESGALVLVIDDLQWADADSLFALEVMLSALGNSPVLLLITARTGTEPPRIDSPVQRIELRELDGPSATLLARSLLTQATPQSTLSPAELAREARGLPLFVEMLVQSIKSRKSVRPVALEELLRARVEMFLDEPRHVLELVSLAARPASHLQLSMASGLKPAEVVSEVRALRAQRWVLTRRHDSETVVEPYHDNLRRAVVDAMSPDRKKRIHHDWAVVLEQSLRPADQETLARHWDGAGEPLRALDHAIDAAQRAQRGLAFDHAAQLYGWALELAPVDHPERRELHRAHARSLSDAGRGRDAATAYLAAGRLAQAPERWALQLQASEQLLRAGHVDEGLSAIDDVLSPLGMDLPRHPVEAIAALVRERLLRAVNPFVSLALARKPKHRAALEQKSDACYAVAVGLAQVDPLCSAAFTARYLRYAELLGDRERLALGFCLRAPQIASAGAPATEAHELLRRVRAAIPERGDRGRLEANLALAVAGVAILTGDFRATLENGEKALALFEKLPGSTWEAATAQRFVLTCLWQTGELKELERRTLEVAADADERNDRYAANQLRTTVLPIVHLKNDDSERAWAELERADRDMPGPRSSLQRWQYRQYASLVAIYRGEPREALELMRQQKIGPARFLIWRVAALRISTAFHRATAVLSILASSRQPAIAEHSRGLQRDIAEIAREPAFQHLVCLLKAQIARLNHDEQSAAVLLEQAERQFRQSGMGLYASVSAWGRSAVGDRDPSHRKRAEAWMSAQEIENPPRFVGLLAPVFKS